MKKQEVSKTVKKIKKDLCNLVDLYVQTVDKEGWDSFMKKEYLIEDIEDFIKESLSERRARK